MLDNKNKEESNDYKNDTFKKGIKQGFISWAVKKCLEILFE